MISIIIPLYNKEKFIKNTLEHVLSQTYSCFEIVIVDDGSTDASVNIVKTIEDNRIRIVQQVNQGVSAARNRGVHEAKYEYVAFLDADDIWDVEYLEAIHNLICKYPECSVYATGYHHIINGRTLQKDLYNIGIEEGDDGVLYNYFDIVPYNQGIIWSSAVAVKKSALLHIGGFPVGVISGEDLITWVRLAIEYKIAYSNRNLSIFNQVDWGDNIGRIPTDNDYVGMELHKLSIRNSQIIPLLATWYRSRCVIAARSGKKYIAFKNLKQWCRYSQNNYRYKFFWFSMLFLPVSVINYLYKNIKR